MAKKGHGEFGWSSIPKSQRVCRHCEMPIKKLADVAETRTLHSLNKQVLLCAACFKDQARIGATARLK